VLFPTVGDRRLGSVQPFDRTMPAGPQRSD